MDIPQEKVFCFNPPSPSQCIKSEVGVALMSSATRYSAKRYSATRYSATKRDKENEKRPLFWGATRLLAH